MERDQELVLVDRLREGDATAFDVVYDAYRSRLFGYLLRVSQRRDVAEDLLEETWMRLVTHAARLHPDTRLGPWLFTVARRLFWSYCRSRDIEDHHVVAWPARVHSVAVDTPSPFEVASAHERAGHLERALATLPAGDRDVLLLVANGLAPADAAGICGIRPEAFRQRLSRARGRLVAAIERAARARQRISENVSS